MSAESSPVAYEVVHTTRYVYADSVSVSHHLARLSPRALPYQECLHHALDVTPEPAVRTAHTDYFGNAMTFFAMQGAHAELTVTARSRVSVAPRTLPVAVRDASLGVGHRPVGAAARGARCAVRSPVTRVGTGIRGVRAGLIPGRDGR